MKIVIFVAGDPSADGYFARAYDDETDEHLWSSEGASSLDQALSEIAAGIERVTAARNQEEQ